jgi:ABC-2 type transport system ATP-binding protein
MSCAISFESVRKTYARGSQLVEALDGVSFHIPAGAFFGLLGPNGAGKTTLIQILATLTQPSSGHVSIDGIDVQAHPQQARRLLGLVPQELVFDPFFSIRETLRIQSGYFGLNRNEDWIDELLHCLGLTDKAETNLRQLSGGMKRRVLVAQALVHKPPVIVLDEPTAGVDVALRQALWQFITRLHREGHTVLLTTHYLEEAQSLCSHLALLQNGKLIALDKTETLLGRYQETVLSVTTDNPLPDFLGVIARRHGRVAQWVVHSVQEIQSHLEQLQAVGIQASQIEIRPPDLEDVFLTLTQQPQQLQQQQKESFHGE